MSLLCYVFVHINVTEEHHSFIHPVISITAYNSVGQS